MEDKLNMIVSALSEKATVKQLIFRNTKAVFAQLKSEAETLVAQIAEKMAQVDDSVEVEFKDVNEFEFRIKFSGDLLMFTMHSNVTAFTPEHILSSSPYINEDYRRGYYGTIMVHNFMADSVRYNRLGDMGYLLGRMMLNFEGHFYVEGMRQFGFLYPDIAENLISAEVLRFFVEYGILMAVNNDLTAPDYQSIQVIPLGQKLANQMVFGGEKLGFRMSGDQS